MVRTPAPPFPGLEGSVAGRISAVRSDRGVVRQEALTIATERQVYVNIRVPWRERRMSRTSGAVWPSGWSINSGC